MLHRIRHYSPEYMPHIMIQYIHRGVTLNHKYLWVNPATCFMVLRSIHQKNAIHLLHIQKYIDTTGRDAPFCYEDYAYGTCQCVLKEKSNKLACQT